MIKFLKFRNFSYVATFEDQSDALFAAYGNEFYDAYTRTFSIADSDNIRLTPAHFRRNETSDDDLRAYLSYAKTRARGNKKKSQNSETLNKTKYKKGLVTIGIDTTIHFLFNQ